MGCGSRSRPLPRLARPGAGLVPVPVPGDAPPRPASGTAGACPSSPLKGCRVQEGRAALLGAVFLFLSRFPFPTDVSPTQRGGCTAHIGPWCEDGGVSRCVVSFPRRRQGLGLPPGHPQPGRWPVTAPHPGMGTPAQRSLTLTPTGLGWGSGPGSVCEHGCVRARWCGGRGRGPALLWAWKVTGGVGCRSHGPRWRWHSWPHLQWAPPAAHQGRLWGPRQGWSLTF